MAKSEMESNIEVAVGTYEELILGYHLSLDDNNYEFTQSFTNHSHTGCIKKLAISQNGILASGGTDEAIWLFNLKKRIEIGSLVHHSGTITWLDFFKSTHLFSTSEDAKLCVWKAFSWECLRTFKGHKGRINCVAVHPSGKMALTVGQDRSLHTWNLVRGRSAYITNIKQAADIVQWSPDGSIYLTVFHNRIDLYKTETAAVYHTVNADRRINAVIFLRSNLIAYGGERGDIVIFNCEKRKEVHRIVTDTIRIRDLVKVKTTHKDCSLILLSASSDGHIKAYKLVFSQDSVTGELIASHDTKFRLTCIAAAQLKTKTKAKKDKDSDLKTEMKQKVESSDEVLDEVEEDSDEIDDDESDVEEKSSGKSSEADSGHQEESSDSDSSEEKRKSRKTSFLEYKKAQKLKRKMKEEVKRKEEMKKRKKEKIKGSKIGKKMSPKVKKVK